MSAQKTIYVALLATIFRSQKPIEQIMNLQLHFVAFELEEVKEYVSELPRSMLLRCCGIICSVFTHDQRLG